MSSAINKCSTANDQVKTDTCKVIKTTLKFDNENYIAVSRDLTGMEYTFQSIGAFYNNFLNCLNDQNASTTASETIRNLDHLIYQLDTFVITGIETKFITASESLGIVFGEKTKNVVYQITDQYVKEFNSVRENLKLLRENFAEIAKSGNVITIATINATLSAEAFNVMITAFKDIEVTTKQFSSVVSNFVLVSASLEKISNSISVVQTGALAKITKDDYDMEISVQAAKKMFAIKSLALQSDVEDSFGEFQIVGAQLFPGDLDIQSLRATAERFIIQLKEVFGQSSNHFQTFFTERQSESSKRIRVLKKSVAEMAGVVSEFVAQSVSQNSGSFAKCFDSVDNTKLATAMIETLGTSSSLCISQQTNTSLTAQSLLTFISEDTVLNVKTQADRLCACAVKGDAKTDEKSKRCMKRVRDQNIVENKV